ncbi:MAG TPA: membrane protein insertion efficiency factor YidD [Candidatus Obscuribacterales bacterium]
MKGLLLFAIALYQRTRALRRPVCRFYPSCSRYMAGCLDKHGLLKGTMLAVWRLLRCHPLHPGGVDDVPGEFSLWLWQGSAGGPTSLGHTRDLHRADECAAEGRKRQPRRSA